MSEPKARAEGSRARVWVFLAVGVNLGGVVAGWIGGENWQAVFVAAAVIALVVGLVTWIRSS